MKKSRFLVIGALLILLVLSVILGLSFGSTTNLPLELVIQLRLPRVVLAFAVGGALAVAGTILQATFSNPLCEPYTLGVSSGATLGTVIGTAIGFQLSSFGIFLPALLGSSVFSFFIYAISHFQWVGQLQILLSGVMLSFLGSSLVALWMAFADPMGLQGTLSWLLGDLSRAELNHSLFTLVLVSLITLFTLRFRSALDAFLLGENEAAAQGVPIKRVRSVMILYTSLLVSLSVSAAGMIGFVGLLTPHLIRRVITPRHLWVIPTSFVLGGVLMILSDLLSRTLFAPNELPVGVVTALIGAPLFIFLLLKRNRSYV